MRSQKALRAQGVTILLITHKLKEIMAITDVVSVMRGGEMVAHLATQDTSPRQLAELMVGEPVLLDVGYSPPTPTDICLKADNISLTQSGTTKLDGLSFSLRSGEILGIAAYRERAVRGSEILSGIRPIWHAGCWA